MVEILAGQMQRHRRIAGADQVPETLEIQRVAAVPSEIFRLASFKMKRFDRVDGEYDPLEKNWIHEMGLSNERDDAVKILHAVSKEDLSDDQPGGVLGKMPGEGDLPNDQPAGVLGKMPREDDLSNDQPAADAAGAQNQSLQLISRNFSKICRRLEVRADGLVEARPGDAVAEPLPRPKPGMYCLGQCFFKRCFWLLS